MPKSEPVVKELLKTIPQIGNVEFISIRPERRADPAPVKKVMADAKGLVGDHFSSTYSDKRAVTLIQAEHLDAVANILACDIDATQTRRNIVVSGINLYALRSSKFKIGKVVLEGTGECHPCSRMEENFGPGGYNAMRGHGGITARVLEGGEIALADTVEFIENS